MFTTFSEGKEMILIVTQRLVGSLSISKNKYIDRPSFNRPGPINGEPILIDSDDQAAASTQGTPYRTNTCKNNTYK